MTTVKLSELTELTTPSSNTEKTFLLVTDTQTGLAVSRKMSVKTLDTLMDVTQGQANLAFNHANSGFNQANAAFIRANNSLSANSGGIVTGDVSITGNLTVTGVTTYTNTQTVLVADNILTLNAAIDQSAAPSLNAGLEIDRGSSANVYLLWNESNDKWTFTEDGTNYDSIGSASTASYANAAFIHANSAFIHANSVFDVANAAAGTDVTQNNSITAAFNQANAAFDIAYSTSFYANAAFIQANTPSHVANSAAIYANGAFAAANTAEAYTAANLSTELWATSPPATLQAAIERLANVVIVLNGYTPIP
jgi:hypothetical protein